MSELIGYDNEINSLIEKFNNHNLHNSIILYGSKGIGKRYFVNELIHLSDEMYHHPEILINHNEVTITLYTKDLNDVSDRDIEMSKKIDELIEDINVIKFRG